MKDQTDELSSRRIDAAQMNSALPARVASHAVERIRRREPEFALVTPRATSRSRR